MIIKINISKLESVKNFIFDIKSYEKYIIKFEKQKLLRFVFLFPKIKKDVIWTIFCRSLIQI